MPQGWVKFYEFSLGDLRAGVNVVDMVTESGGNIDWETVVGLMENAIYGGRVDNSYDFQVLQTYLKQYMNDDVLLGRGGRGNKVTERGLMMIQPTTNRQGTFFFFIFLFNFFFLSDLYISSPLFFLLFFPQDYVKLIESLHDINLLPFR